MKHLIVKDFGPIEQADIELKSYNFFIGSQGVGKSTLGKIMCVISNYVMYLNARTTTTREDHLFFMKLLLNYNISPYLKATSYISYEESKIINDPTINKNNVEYKVTFNFENGRISTKLFENGIVVNNTFDSYYITILSFFTDFRKKSHEFFSKKDNNKDSVSVDDFIQFFNNSLYVPAERIMFSIFDKLLPALNLVKSSIPELLLHFAIDYNNAKSDFPVYDIPMLDVSYLREDDKDYIQMNNTKKKLLLSAASSGIQSTIPMLLTLNEAINKNIYHTYVIEEPEMNLYPDNQINLLNEILKMISKRETKSSICMTITTHSPYLINYLNVLIRRYSQKNKQNASIDPNDLSVYSINKKGNTTNLMSKDNHSNEIVVNTLDLSEEMGNIYDEYLNLENN